MGIAGSVGLFVLAGLMEIAGGYLVWLWLREGRAIPIGALGGLLLFLYGVVPTLQPAHFGRVYAAYGGVFVIPIATVGLVDRRAAARCRRLGRGHAVRLGRRGHHVLAAHLTRPAAVTPFHL